MEIKISIENFYNIVYDNEGNVVPFHIDYNDGDTIIITSSNNISSDNRGEKLHFVFRECKKPYHLVFENGQKIISYDFQSAPTFEQSEGSVNV